MLSLLWSLGLSKADAPLLAAIAATGCSKIAQLTPQEILIVNASARPPRLAGLPNVGTCNYRYTGI